MDFKEINLSNIKRTENYRTKAGDLGELMSSIKENGLLQPIGVKKTKSGYELIFGNRRYAAYKKLGKKTIPCSIIDNSKNNAILNLIENIQRENTTMFEVGRAMNRLTKEGLTVTEIMARLSVSKSYVRMSMDVFKMTPPKFRSKVVNMDSFQKTSKKGFIASTVASTINNTAKRHNLSKAEISTFYDYASVNEISAQSACTIVKLLGDGHSLKESLKNKSKVKCFRAPITMRQDEYDRLLNKYGQDFVGQIFRKQTYEKIKPVSKMKIKKK